MHALAGDERIPIYQRLADTLRQSVITGALKPGDRAVVLVVPQHGFGSCRPS